MQSDSSKIIFSVALGVLASVLLVFSIYRIFGSTSLSQNRSYQVTVKTISEETDAYTINGSYPRIEGRDAFNGIVESFIQKQANDFKTNVSQSIVPPPLKGVKSSLIINFSVEGGSPDFISVLFATENYIAGMAHPSHELVSINFDFRSNKELALSDMFVNNPDYLKAVSSYATNDILKQISSGQYGSTEDYLNMENAAGRGTSANAENYGVFTIAKNGLVIHFNEYQVGPYVSGPASSTIPFGTITGMRDPNAPL